MSTFDALPKRVQKLSGKLLALATAYHSIGYGGGEDTSKQRDYSAEYLEKEFEPIKRKIKDNGWGDYGLSSVTDEWRAVDVAWMYYSENK